jgi:hypothetical protein
VVISVTRREDPENKANKEEKQAGTGLGRASDVTMSPDVFALVN